MSIVRNRKSGSNANLTWTYINSIQGTPPFPSNYPITGTGEGDLQGTVKAMQDTVTPKFHKLRAQGIFINSPLNIDVITSSVQTPSTRMRQARGVPFNGGYQYAVYDTSGDFASSVFGKFVKGSHAEAYAQHPLPFSMSSLVNRAKLKAFNRVEPPQSQSLVTVLEFHKSLSSIADRARKLASVIQDVRFNKGRNLETILGGKVPRHKPPKRVVMWDDAGHPIFEKKTGRTQSKWAHPLVGPTPSKMEEARTLWLETRYAWTPLVYDIIDTLKAMYADDLRSQLIQYKVMRATARETETGKVISNVYGSFGGSLMAEIVATHDVTVGAYILYKLDAPSGILRRLNDFGAFDVPKALVEIMPWSFVLEWFIPIGDFLGALQPKFGVDILASGLTTKYDLVATRTVKSFQSNPPSGDQMWTSSPIPIGTQTKVSYLRKSREVPLTVPTYPPVTINLNSQKLVDAVALLKGLSSSSSSSHLRR